MSKKSGIFILVVIAVTILAGCSFFGVDTKVNKGQEPADTNGSANPNEPMEQEHYVFNWGIIYGEALDAFMELDAHINEGITYIAVGTEVMPEVTDADIEYILNYMKKYGVEVFESTFEELVERDMFSKETFSLEGIYINIDSVEIVGEKELRIGGSKLRAGLEFSGMECVLKYQNGKWEVVSSELVFF